MRQPTVNSIEDIAKLPWGGNALVDVIDKRYNGKSLADLVHAFIETLPPKSAQRLKAEVHVSWYQCGECPREYIHLLPESERAKAEAVLDAI